jgi:hypothetical protein
VAGNVIDLVRHVRDFGINLTAHWLLDPPEEPPVDRG